MRVIEARNVNGAWVQGVRLLMSRGEEEESRSGSVMVYPNPVTTVYGSPQERVLFCPVRAANPFFHLFESMWMLAGENSARWLDMWVHDFSSRFAESDGRMHGAYGHRWRHTFQTMMPSGAHTRDQLLAVGALLRADPTTRQAVVSMWSPERDLCVAGLLDRPCNTHIYFRPREDGWLDMTVMCRSNDIVWGAYGANSVHMSVMHEYVACLAGMRQGTMWQVSNNWHGYTSVLGRMATLSIGDCDLYDTDVVSARPLFHEDGLPTLVSEIRQWMVTPTSPTVHQNPQLFNGLLVPMARVHRAARHGDLDGAMDLCNFVAHSDWQRAARDWVQRRLDARDQT